MLSPIRNITFTKIYKNQRTKQNKPQNQTNTINQTFLNNAYYMPFLGKESFFSTLDKNYFQLPQIEFENGTKYQLRPDECQLECAKKLYEGDDVVFCAPTGTGKTAVAHYIMTKNLNEGKKTYTTPLKALANDKLREFRKIYGEENVGLLTGDIKINTTAPIQIMTCEIYNNQTLQLSKNPRNIATVIFDEAHYLGDKERGNVWENSIINTPSDDIQILCLSATIGNSDDLRDWIQKLNPNRNVSKVELPSQNRHVPLIWHLYKPKTKQHAASIKPIIKKQINLNDINPDNLTQRQKRACEILFRNQNNIQGYYELTSEEYQQAAYDFLAKFEDIKDGEMKLSSLEERLKALYPNMQEMQIKEVAQFLASEETQEIDAIHTMHLDDDYATLITDLNKEDMLPALIFKLSKNACFNIAMSLKEQKVDLTTQEEKEEIKRIIDEYRNNDIYLGNSFDMEMVLNGYAYHHSDILPHYKKLIEELFSKKLLKTVIATSTLSAGINMPARTVVISDTFYKKYNPKSGEIEFTPLSANDFHQMAGRAGRRGIDKLGHVVFYNLDTPQDGFKTDLMKKKQAGEKVKTSKNFDKLPDELALAYELLDSDANNLRSYYKPDWCLLAQYIEENPTNDKLKDLIDLSFKIHSSKEPQKDANKLLNKFHNYEVVLLKNGFIEKDNKGNMHLTPKGRILKMCQGLNPLVLADLIYNEKFDGVMMENLCQMAAYIAGSSNQIEEEGMIEEIEKKLISIFGEEAWENDIKEEYRKTQSAFLEAQAPILRSQTEGRVSPDNIAIADSFSGFAAFLFSRLNISNKNPKDSIENFRKITGSIPSVAVKVKPKESEKGKIKEISPSQKELIRKSGEGNIYKIIAQTISTLKQIDKICDFALENKSLYPNQNYYEDLKENALISRELLEQIPFNDELSL